MAQITEQGGKRPVPPIGGIPRIGSGGLPNPRGGAASPEDIFGFLQREVGGRLGFGPVPESARALRKTASNVLVLGGLLGLGQELIDTGPAGSRGPIFAPTQEERSAAAMALAIGATEPLGRVGRVAKVDVLKTAEDLITERGGRAPEVAAIKPDVADKYAGNINLQRIDAPDEVKDQIRLAQEQIARPKPQTHDETLAFARETLLSAKLAGKDPLDLATSFVGRQLKREEVTAIRIAAAEQATNAAVAASEAVGKGLDPESVVKAERAIIKHLSMQETLSGVTREAGGTLDSFNIVVNAEQGNFAQALQKLGALDKRKDFIAALARIDPKDQARIAKFTRDVEAALQKEVAVKAPPVDWKWWLNHVYINGIMSGLSNVRNALGNSLKVAKTIGELYGATAIPGGLALREANAFSAAMFTRGLSRGAAKAAHIFKHRITEDFSKLDEPYSQMVRYPTNAAGARVADALGLPSRAMLAVDGFFKGMFEEAFKSYYAERAAAKAGLRGAQRDAFIADRIVNPTLEEIKNARLAAMEYTFNAQPGKVVEKIIDVRNALPGAKLFMPFINTPANIIKDAVQSTPAGLIGARGAKGAFGKAESAVRYSRAILGSAAMWGIYTQMVEGNITGFNPYRPGTTEWEIWNKDNLEVALKTPWGDISLLNYPPISTVFKFVASAQDTQRKYGPDGLTPELMGRIALRLAQTTFDESFFSQIANVYDAIEDPDRALKNVVRGIISAPVPYSGALRLINQVRGLPPREPLTFEEYVAANIPPLAELLRPRLTALGPQEAKVQGPLALLPSRIQQPHADEFERRLLYLRDNFGLTLPEPLQRDVGRSVRLSDQELYELRKNTYPKILDAMHKVMSASDFQNLPEQEQTRRLRDAFDAARADGKIETAFTVLLPRAATPEEVSRVALIGLSSYSRYADKAKWIEDITKAGKMTDEAKRLIDNARSVPAQGQKPEPTVEEYLRYAPLVREYLAAKPILVGSPEEWQRLQVARREYEAARAANAMTPKPALVRKYDLSSVKNQKRSRLLSRNPGLERFVGDSAYRWEP